MVNPILNNNNARLKIEGGIKMAKKGKKGKECKK